MNNRKILFMGTPDFAAIQLEYLIEKQFDICGVVCRPDSPSSRGLKLTPPPVKIVAQRLLPDIPIYQPTTYKDSAGIPMLEETSPDLIVVVAYGRILPEYILKFPKYGCINLHGSVLPALRGAAPIQRAIIDGHRSTGLTLQFMSAGMDEGDIISKTETEIGPDETYGMLNTRLAELGKEFLARGIRSVFDGSAVPVPQDASLATYAAMIQKEECKMDFSQDASHLYNKFRGVTPNPGATFERNGKRYRLTAAALYDGACPDSAPGTVFFPSKKRVAVVCGSGAIEFLRAAPEGKKEMSATDMINGRSIVAGDVLL